MQNSQCIELFEKYLSEAKKASANTLSSYLRDVRQLGAYLETHTDEELDTADEDTLAEYVSWLKGCGKSVSTVSRSIASIKCLYTFLSLNKIIEANPSTKLVPDKSTQKLPQILTSKEVELLLEQPECVDAKGYRDRAMLELLYATGIRVTELIDLNISDVNLAAGVIRCHSRNKERFIPMYSTAIKALSEYISLVRPQMIALAGRAVVVCERWRRENVAPGLLEDNQALSEKSQYRERYHSSYAAAFFCRPPA